ncbi:MAG: serine/threonine-protein kinase [Planctomycetota bacterium]
MHQPGSQLGGCRLGAPLGRGATALTWDAHHLALDIPVVLKLLDPSRAQGQMAVAERFLAEGRVLARLSHPGVVRVLSAGEERGQVYLVLERLAGPSLRGALREGLPELEEAVEWTARLAEGLGAVHAAGLVHRDVKPENILFDAEGYPKLVDFGLAFGEGQRDTAQVMGTPAYMSPEAAQGRALDGRSDLYSLGVVLFELLCNRWPFNAPSPRLILEKQVREEVDTRPLKERGVPRPVLAFVERAMAKDPADRPPDGASFAEELRAAASRPTLGKRKSGARGKSLSSSGHRLPARGPGGRGAPRARSKGSNAGVVLLLLALCGAAVGATYYFVLGRPPAARE